MIANRPDRSRSSRRAQRHERTARQSDRRRTFLKLRPRHRRASPTQAGESRDYRESLSAQKASGRALKRRLQCCSKPEVSLLAPAGANAPRHEAQLPCQTLMRRWLPRVRVAGALHARTEDFRCGRLQSARAGRSHRKAVPPESRLRRLSNSARVQSRWRLASDRDAPGRTRRKRDPWRVPFLAQRHRKPRCHTTPALDAVARTSRGKSVARHRDARRFRKHHTLHAACRSRFQSIELSWFADTGITFAIITTKTPTHKV